jgi:hypothetical protein
MVAIEKEIYSYQKEETEKTWGDEWLWCAYVWGAMIIFVFQNYHKGSYYAKGD